MNDPQTSSPRHRVVIDPLTRVEGHGKVTFLLDDAGNVTQARLHIVEFRGFEHFVRGRPFEELPAIVQRLCGICPVSHQLAAGKAMDRLVGVTRLSPAATALRRLLHYAQVLQSHALHFFYLAAPDLLLAPDTPDALRSMTGLVRAHPTLARDGIRMRRWGQNIIEAITGRRIHGVAVVAGGMLAPFPPERLPALQSEADWAIDTAANTLALLQTLYAAGGEAARRFGGVHWPVLALVAANGDLELYDGVLRLREPEGHTPIDGVDPITYDRWLQEEVKPWSYMKFPFLASRGTEGGGYRVGPLARVLACSRIATPGAEAARQAFLEFHAGTPIVGVLAMHWARMIEVLHCAETLKRMLNGRELLDCDLRPQSDWQSRGVGVIEAPRGLLIHDYELDSQRRVSAANLIVSTTHNNRAMNATLLHVARSHIDGHALTPAVLRAVEMALRAYDPCLSCSTHAVGKMPLQLELHDAAGNVVDRCARTDESSS